MTRLVSDLTPRPNNGPLVAADRLMILDDNNELFTTQASEFRGPAVFYSTLAPTNVPENNYITRYPFYIEGDIFVQNSAEGVLLYIYEGNILQWQNSVANLKGSGFYVEADLTGTLLNADTSVTPDLLIPIMKGNDFYYNVERGVLYLYDPISGLNLPTTDYTRFQHMRGNLTHTVVGNDVDGYTDLAPYLALAVDANNPLHHPKTGDTLWLQKPNGNLHGGFYWTFDEEQYTNSFNTGNNTHVQNLIQGFGGNVARSYKREPSLFSVDAEPTQNNNSYRQGDTLVFGSTQAMYSGYVESAVPITNVSDLFTDITALRGSTVHSTTLPPVADDGLYLEGDFIYTDSNGTPRIHGPYVIGGATDLDSWPLFSVNRSPFEHISPNSPVTVFPANTYPLDSNGIMIVDGDIWVEEVSPVNLLEYSDRAIVDVVAGTITWGLDTISKLPTRFHRVNATGIPSADDTQYTRGDYCLTDDAILYGPYVIGAATDELAWAVSITLSPAKRVVADVGFGFVPPTTNSNVLWGGALLVEGDELLVSFVGTTTNKEYLYNVDSIDPISNDITWSLPVNRHGVRSFTENTRDHAVRDDLSYSTGDYIENLDGVLFGPYVEGQASDALAWPFLRINRPPKTFTQNVINSTYALQTPHTSGESFLVGDKIHFIFPSGKIHERVFQSAGNPYAAQPILSNPPTNPLATKVFHSDVNTLPVLNDNTYSEGDFIINGSGTMYGPYSEGEITDTLAWPLQVNLGGAPVFTDTVTGINYNITITNGVPYFIEL